LAVSVIILDITVYKVEFVFYNRTATTTLI